MVVVNVFQVKYKSAKLSDFCGFANAERLVGAYKTGLLVYSYTNSGLHKREV